VTTVAEYRSSRELFVNLTLRELRSKYKRSVLGWAWSLLNPLATMLIFTLVFKYFMKIQAPTGRPSGMNIFALYLLVALLPWNYVNAGVFGSIGTLVGNSNLIKKTYFPRELLVAAQVAACLVSFLIEMSILLIALQLFGNFWLPYLPVALLLAAILTIYVTGLGLIFSVFNVYFRDVQHLMGIVFQVWFYLTPVVYPIQLVPIKAHVGTPWLLPVKTLYRLNPLVGFVEAFRRCLYDLRMPTLGSFAYLLAVSLATLFLGLFIFAKLEGKLAEEL
jgi:ABC-type polysaccharide/polyol phosphate export permease